MLCPAHVLLGLSQIGRDRPALKVLLRAQQREFEPRDFDPPHFMPCGQCALGIGISQCMQQVTGGRIGMALNNYDAFCHGSAGAFTATGGSLTGL